MNEHVDRADRMVREIRERMMSTVREAKRAQDLRMKRSADEVVRGGMDPLIDRSRYTAELYREGAAEAHRAGADRRRVQMLEARAEAMRAYSAVLTAATTGRAPLAASVKRALRSQYPGMDQEVLNTKAGRLTQAAGLEEAIALTPKDPREWDPDREQTLGRARTYIRAVDALHQENRSASKRTRDRDVQGGALREQVTMRMSPEQKRIQSQWQKKTVAAATGTGTAGDLPPRTREALRNSAGHGHVLGIPPMPPVDPRRELSDSAVMGRQSQMLSQLETRVRGADHMIPPRPTVRPTVGLDR